jgi:hypothetical protein
MAMNNKMGSVFMRIFALMCMVLIASGPVPAAYALSLTQIEAVPGAEEATISWKTDVAANSFVNYTDGDTDVVVEDPTFVKNHSIILDALIPSTSYEYQVVSVSSGIVDEARSNWLQFTTLPAVDGDLFFEADVPAYTNGAPISFSGVTLTDAHVVVYVDGQPRATAYANANGTVQIRNIRMTTSKEEVLLRVVVSHPAYEESLEKEYKVMIDTRAPRVVIDRIPAVSVDGGVTIRGTVDEAVLLEVFTRDVQSGITDEAFSEEVNGTFSTALSTGIKLYD